MKSLHYGLFLTVVCVAMSYCYAPSSKSKITPVSESKEKANSQKKVSDSHSFSENYYSKAFDFPVGVPDAKNYYNAQGFGQNGHLGDDWNGTGGGNTDLGDPVYAISSGVISEAYDAGPGWGNVMRIIHKIGEENYVESLYAHLDSMEGVKGDSVKRGKQIGTIGNANGAYLAHLHLELRHQIHKPLGGGYSSDTAGYLDPTKFINNHRKVMWKMSR